MAWEGWQVGMSGPTVSAAKRKLKAKFSYARALDESGFFGDDLKAVVAEFQRRKNASNGLNLRTDGVLDWATQVALGIIEPNPPAADRKKGVILTVHGTYVSMWDGYPADVARAVQDDFLWQPVGNYPASAFPMRDSYEQGVEELVVQCRRHAGQPKVLAGYSQGAICVSRVWKHEVVDPAGRLHDLKDEFVAGLTWGNPDRELGVANGNRLEGVPVPEGRGITDDRMVSTPDWWLDFAHGANSRFGRDVYCDVPDDDSGEYATAVWKIVEAVQLSGSGSILERAADIVRAPLVEIAAIVKAVMYGGAFFFTRTGPHLNYSIDPAVKYLKGVAAAL